MVRDGWALCLFYFSVFRGLFLHDNRLMPSQPSIPSAASASTPSPLLSTLLTLSLSSLAGSLVGLSLLRRKPPASQAALRHLPLQWGVRVGVFVGCYEFGRFSSSFCRSVVYEAAPHLEPAPSPLLGKANYVFDSLTGGLLAGLFSSAALRTQFVRDGGRLLRVEGGGAQVVARE